MTNVIKDKLQTVTTLAVGEEGSTHHFGEEDPFDLAPGEENGQGGPFGTF